MPSQKLLRPKLADHLPLEEVTIAEALKESGYATGFFGKWHLGGKEYWPDKQGFDVNIGGCQLGHPPSYFSPYKIPAIADGPKGEYLTDRLTDEACKFIESNQRKPFFLYFPHYAVHNPQQAKPELIEHFKKKASPASDFGELSRVAGGPEFLEDHGRKVRQFQNHPTYAANIASLDQSVGRILQKLADLHLDDNTIVIFTSDNGGLSTAEGTPTSNAPLRMGKGWNYEGGVRVPLIVKWPGVTQAGAVCQTPTISTDFYATLLDIASLPPRPAQHLDSVSIVPALKGQPMPERPLFWHYPHYSNQGGPPSAAIRLGAPVPASNVRILPVVLEIVYDLVALSNTTPCTVALLFKSTVEFAWIAPRKFATVFVPLGTPPLQLVETYHCPLPGLIHSVVAAAGGLRMSWMALIGARNVPPEISSARTTKLPAVNPSNTM
jgi:hypothetical protein